MREDFGPGSLAGDYSRRAFASLRRFGAGLVQFSFVSHPESLWRFQETKDAEESRK